MMIREIACRSSVLLLVLAGCQTAPGVEEESSVPEIAAREPVRTFSESETAGPLVYPVSLVAMDSGVWILDAGAKRIVFLPRNGAAIPVGREGSGPGEFKNPVGLHPLAGGRVFSWDQALRRVTELDAPDRPPATRSTAFYLQGLTLKHALPAADGLLGIFDKSADALNAPEGEEGSLGVVAYLDEAGGRLDTLTHFPLSGPIIVRESTSSGFSMTAFTPPFDAIPHADWLAACGGLAAVATGGRHFELRFFGSGGEALGALHLPILGPEVTVVERDRYFAQFSQELHRAHNLRANIQVPDRHPAVNAVRLTRSGHLWVRLTPPGTESLARWRVWLIERNARPRVELGPPIDLLLPGRFSVQDVSQDEIWGFFYDDLDVPTVRTYPLPEALGTSCEGDD